MAAPALLLILALLLLSAGAFEARNIETVIRSATERDLDDVHLIRELPGAPPVSFAMRSGYITVDEQAGRALFYWFVEANGPDPASAPLTLWLNGGPGCSSVGGGMLSELGPFYPTKDGSHLQENPFAWNKVSNMLFLESPAGVGFSYSNTSSDYKTGDERTAADSYVFLLRFFEKYPQYFKNDFYITGESYAGHYVPQLAALIVKLNELAEVKINLKGIAIGNAWTDADIDNHGAIFYWWSHALISDTTYRGVVSKCNFSDVGPLLGSREDDNCLEYVDAAGDELGTINIYEIYVDVCISSQAQSEIRHFAKQLSRTKMGGIATGPLSSNTYDPCVDDEVEVYMNRPEVQQALHANVTGIPYPWSDCSDIVDYSNADLLSSVLPLYHTLLESGLEIFIFSGDTDAIVPVTGTRAWLSTLPLKIKSKWRPWYLNNQVGGYVTQYDKLTFSTVRGAGHMVPYTQPAPSIASISSFFRQDSLIA